MRIALLALAACAHAELRGDPVLRPGALVIFGEMHGTNEIPRFLGDEAEAAVQRHLRVHVGLELPGPDGSLWTDAFQSGRTSEAMARLIDRLRALPVDLFWFDSTAADRDGAMASAISAERAKAPADLYLVLVGNLHARRKPGAPWDPDIRWMATRLAGEPDMITLDVRYGAGTAWICQGNTPTDCRVTTLRGSAASFQPGVTLQEQPEGYDGVFFVGPIRASPPAHPR